MLIKRRKKFYETFIFIPITHIIKLSIECYQFNFLIIKKSNHQFLNQLVLLLGNIRIHSQTLSLSLPPPSPVPLTQSLNKQIKILKILLLTDKDKDLMMRVTQ